VPLIGNRLALLIVEKIQRGQFDEFRVVAAHLELQRANAADRRAIPGKV
jgi:hypothetical protein